MSPLRPRNSILEALLALKALDPRISVNEVIAFLYTCENEGLSVQELACVADLTQSTASRSLRALGPPDHDWAQPPALGLVEPFLNPSDGRSHVIYLSARGREVRDRLDRLIRRAAPIQIPGWETSHLLNCDVRRHKSMQTRKYSAITLSLYAG